MDVNLLTAELFDDTQHKSITSLLDCVNNIFEDTVLTSDDLKYDMIDSDFYIHIVELNTQNKVQISFGQSLCDVRCVYKDNLDREHVLNVRYMGKHSFRIASINLPPSDYQKREFSKIDVLIDEFTSQVDGLQSFFAELECIDALCSVVDPAEPTFKHDYRKILLDTRAWLHINVTNEGLPVNVTVVGNMPPWHQKLQDGLPQWDYDQSITDNVLKIFDLTHFPSSPTDLSQITTPTLAPQHTHAHTISCAICLCGSETAAPLPLCRNEKCGVYYHSACLYAWLVSRGARAPLGLVAGPCPNCGTHIHTSHSHY